METVELLVKGIPQPIFNMFRGFCSVEGKTESEGVIDVMIDYLEKSTGGGNENLKKVVEEYRKKKKK